MNKVRDRQRTYISLFSCAGVGCYGFKMAGFECVATNELLPQRMEVQKVNGKCKYPSGYICGDATSPETHRLIENEIAMWKEKERLDQVDVVFATPPCQGMSSVNYKKNDHEQIRNSLVVEAIKTINSIRPKVFVFENVRAFMKSVCTDVSGEDMLIEDSIKKNLSNDYRIYWNVINFKDYGVPSSRPRTIVIGTRRDIKGLNPLQLFPTRRREIPLRESIGGFSRLGYGERDANDPFHFARKFPEYMLPWIKDLKEGETAFDNPIETKPYSLDKAGNRIINKGEYMGNKYRRLFWDRPGACIATRSDVMSSQDTIHPCDNRVLSIREIMTLMTVPNTFKWTNQDDALTVASAEKYLRENEGNIRRCIGEAVPTLIGYRIASRIKEMLRIVECEMSDDIKERNDLAFDQVCRLNAECPKVDVKFDGADGFRIYAPLLSAYYSHVEHIGFDVIGKLKKKDLEFIEGYPVEKGDCSNVVVRCHERIPELKVYDFQVHGTELSCTQDAAPTEKATFSQMMLFGA